MKKPFLRLLLAGALAVSVRGSSNVHDVLGRMDRAAAAFKSMTAHVTYVTHTDVLNDNTTDTGSVIMKKVQPGDVQGLVEFTAPDRKTVTIEKRRLKEYFPKINTVQIYDLGRHGEQLDQFVLIGFGTSGTELASSYDVTVAAPTTSDQGAIRLQLLPKSVEAKQYVTKLELWIPEEGDPYPLREKIYEPSGDYILVTYSDLKINPPLPPDALELKLPAGVKLQYPGK